MSGNNRGSEDERRLIEEQLRDVETEEERRQRLEREEAERAAQEQREQKLRQRLEQLCQEAGARLPPEHQPLVRRFLTDDECPAPADDWPPAFLVELHRLGFLRVLARNEGDTTTRLVYADWLDERGEHEEADLQRRWPAAHEWFLGFCNQKANCPEATYGGLIELGHRIVRESGSRERSHIDEDLWYALRSDGQEFWRHWSVLTRTPLPAVMADRGFHSWMCCSHEVCYWFGTPDRSETEEVSVESETDETAQASDSDEASDANLPNETPDTNEGGEPSTSTEPGE